MAVGELSHLPNLSCGAKGVVLPEITIVEGLAGAAEARGAVVVIDVLRAFSVAAYAFDAGVASITLFADPAEALARPFDVRLGEVDGRLIPGFDHDNSPSRLSGRRLAGRGAQRTGAGTRCALLAVHADEIWLSSLVIAGATARALAGRPRITLVASGWPDEGEEDTACAELLRDLILGGPADPGRAVAQVLSSRAAALHRVGDDARPLQDLACVTDVDRFGFAIRAERVGADLVARAVR